MNVDIQSKDDNIFCDTFEMRYEKGVGFIVVIDGQVMGYIQKLTTTCQDKFVEVVRLLPDPTTEDGFRQCTQNVWVGQKKG